MDPYILYSAGSKCAGVGSAPAHLLLAQYKMYGPIYIRCMQRCIQVQKSVGEDAPSRKCMEGCVVPESTVCFSHKEVRVF